MQCTGAMLLVQQWENAPTALPAWKTDGSDSCCWWHTGRNISSEGNSLEPALTICVAQITCYFYRKAKPSLDGWVLPNTLPASQREEAPSLLHSQKNPMPQDYSQVSFFEDKRHPLHPLLLQTEDCQKGDHPSGHLTCIFMHRSGDGVGSFLDK